MNPAFILLAIIAIVLVWFLASGLYRIIGRFFGRIWKDAVDELTEEEEND